MAGAALFIGDTGFFEEVVADRIAPDDRVAGLIFETREHVVEALRVNVTLQRFPLIDEFGDFGSAVVVGIINILNDSFAGMEIVRVRNVMEEKQKFVGSGRKRFINSCDGRTILAGESRAGRNGPVHADSLFVGAMPLA